MIGKRGVYKLLLGKKEEHNTTLDRIATLYGVKPTSYPSSK